MKKIIAIVSKRTNGISLVQGNDYQVIGILANDFQIVDESGEPSLYSKSYFIDFDVAVPQEWVFRHYSHDFYTCYPSEFSERAFFDRYHDRHQKKIDIFNQYVKRHSDCD